jgi:hypothetical protein
MNTCPATDGRAGAGQRAEAAPEMAFCSRQLPKFDYLIAAY